MSGPGRLSDRDGMWRLLIVVTVTLALALCLWHAGASGGHDHNPTPDLCAGIFLVSLVTILLRLASVSELPADLALPIAALSLRRPDPPPRRSFVS